MINSSQMTYGLLGKSISKRMASNMKSRFIRMFLMVSQVMQYYFLLETHHELQALV